MIYFDNSATTQARPEVLATYKQVSEKIWGNPSSLHKLGETAWNLLEQTRTQIANTFGVQPGEILFTSGGTESNNLALIVIVAPVLFFPIFIHLFFSASKYSQ